MKEPIYDWSNLASDYRRLKSDSAVANLYGCNKNTVYQTRLKYGIKSIRGTKHITKPYRRVFRKRQLKGHMYN